jgi:hypothetical protein
VPEQTTKRGDRITAADFTGAFENHLVRLGAGGWNLKDELDVIPPEQASRLTNVDHDQTGAVTSRPGQTSFATGGTIHHSVRKILVPSTGVPTRFWGIDTSLYRGASGALASIDTGYSGDPLALVPHHPPLSGEPWMFVADRSRMRKARASDGLVLPIGLAAPTAAVTATLGIEHRRAICAFDSTDGTQASAWVAVAGSDEHGHPSGLPNAVDESSSPGGTPDVYFTTLDNPSIDSAYDSWFGLTKAVDLSTLSPVSGGGGPIPASDDDILHLWLKTARPQFVREIRVYVVVSAGFVPGDTHLPGTPGSANTDAYVKGFRQNDFVQFIQAAQTQIDAAETARIFALRDEDLEDRATDDDRTSWANARAVIDPLRGRSLQLGGGAEQWFELGSIGLPMRRGDFQRIGATAGRDWSTMTGLIVYVKLDVTATERIASFAMDDFYLTGGYGPDTVEPGAQQYDYRVTNYDPRTGAESNGSPTMSTGLVDSRRQQITVTPAAASDAALRQRIYRRGGSLIDNWFFVGTNTSNGGTFSDQLSDDAISAAGTLPIDHFQPVPTVDAAGATVLAQPVAALWGPIEGMLLACGDPLRPGHLYWSLPDAPDHWSATSNKEICPPSEELMAGDLVGSQAFVFSRERLYLLYPSLTGTATIDYAPSLCTRGIPSRWAFCVGPGGIYFYAEGEGIFVTQGGPETWISRDIDPLFQGQTRYGYPPIDTATTARSAIRLTAWENKIYFTYQATDGSRWTLVYHLLQQFWRPYKFGRAVVTVQGLEEPDLLLGGAVGATYTHTGFSDDGLAIASAYRTGAFTGGRREEKLFGDQILDADRAGMVLSVQNFLNEETTSNTPVTIGEGAGRQRYVLDPFGEIPQKAHSISTEIAWSSASAAPTLYQLGYAITLQPDLTTRRVTNWDDLGYPDEFWLTGITLDVDTGNVARTILVERDFGGVRSTVATLTVQADGRHKLKFSWAAVSANQVRIRPSDECKFWLLYRADWIVQPEPPRVAAWDVHFENAWDQSHTGLDLYCDTLGLTKQVEVYVDNVRQNDPATGLTFFSVTANGRKVVHLTLPWGRGHVYRFVAIDANPGLLYSHRWHLDPEPSEQTNWNQNFSIYGSRADKWLKAVVFECDTFGQNKSVTIEADGVVVETLIINASGRKVVQKALSTERLGRVWRLFPTDSNPGRLYSVQPVFDEEPFQLDRWETQEVNYGLPGWFYPTYGHLVLKSSAPVILSLTRQLNQRGLTRTETYEIPSTGGQKIRHYQTFRAGRDVLHKWVLSSAQPFWLYRDETVVFIQPWGADQPAVLRPFGNSGEDPTRNMVSSYAAATASGGSAAE